MYRLLVKLNTIKNNIYYLHTVINDKGENVPYGVKELESAQQEAKKLLGEVGYNNLKIINDGPYYIEIQDGEEPQEPKALYTLSILSNENNKTNCSITPESIENIEENSSVNVGLVFDGIIPNFHLNINGEETEQGLPEWIEFKALSANEGILYFNGITNDYVIEIVED